MGALFLRLDFRAFLGRAARGEKDVIARGIGQHFEKVQGAPDFDGEDDVGSVRDPANGALWDPIEVGYVAGTG